jgi:hypothetical protein
MPQAGRPENVDGKHLSFTYFYAVSNLLPESENTLNSAMREGDP